MTDFKQNPFMPGMTPEQQAEAMRYDVEMKTLLPQFSRIINGKRLSVNAVLGALAICQAEVIRHCPVERREELFNATQFVLRDVLFGVRSLAMPIAPLVQPGGNGKTPA